MIRTFNNWFWVAPLILIGAIALAIFSVTEEDRKAKFRGSDKFWERFMTVYAYLTGIELFWLFVSESILGAIEWVGRDAEGALLVAACLLMLVAAAWSGLCYATFMAVRKFRTKLIEDACENGRSKVDRQRRRRERRNARHEAREARKQKNHKGNRPSPKVSGKIYSLPMADIVPISEKRSKDKKSKETPKVTEPEQPKKTEKTSNELIAELTEGMDLTSAQVYVIKHRLHMEMRKYELDVYDDLDAGCNDTEDSISAYLPEGVHEYYVAINRENPEAAPTFIGWGNVAIATTNLRRYLLEPIIAQVLAAFKCDIEEEAKRIKKQNAKARKIRKAKAKAEAKKAKQLGRTKKFRKAINQ